MLKLRKLNNYPLIVIAFLSSICVGYSQTINSDLLHEIDEIKQNQRAIQKDLSEIKALLSKLTSQIPAQKPSQKPAPQQPPQIDVEGIEFNIGDNPVLGSESSKLIVVEFTDYQCPFCGRYTRETFHEVRKQYIDKGTPVQNKIKPHNRC